jgi:hypothetical protein
VVTSLERGGNDRLECSEHALLSQVLLDALLDRRVLLSCDHTEVHMRRCGGRARVLSRDAENPFVKPLAKTKPAGGANTPPHLQFNLAILRRWSSFSFFDRGLF